jgi:hypothetical protein
MAAKWRAMALIFLIPRTGGKLRRLARCGRIQGAGKPVEIRDGCALGTSRIFPP